MAEGNSKKKERIVNVRIRIWENEKGHVEDQWSNLSKMAERIGNGNTKGIGKSIQNEEVIFKDEILTSK